MRVGTKVKLVGKHRFLKSDVEYTVSGRTGDFVALEGLDYGCAWHVSNFRVVSCKFEVGDRVDFIDSNFDIATNLEVVDSNIIHGTLKVMYPDGTTGWHGVNRFEHHVPCKFKIGDRVDFINPNAVCGLPTTNLKVIATNRNFVKIEWPDGRLGWWTDGSFKPHEHVHKFKVGDLVDIISPNAKLWHGEFSKNLPICDITSGGTIVVRGIDSKLVGWSKGEVQASQGVGFKVGDRVDTPHGGKDLYVADIHDNNTVKVRYPDGSYGLLHISQCVLSKVADKVRVFHTNAMYYVMPNGTMFYQPPLLKSDFTLESLLKLDGIVEITT